MSNVSTTSKERSKMFETILSSPGMSEKCKIALSLSRQNIILLCRLLDKGLLMDKKVLDDEIIAAFPGESVDDLRIVHDEILKKADLTEFYERLKLL